MRRRRGSARGRTGRLLSGLWGLGAFPPDHRSILEALRVLSVPLSLSWLKRVEWWGAGSTCPGDRRLAPWVGLACWSWCCRAGFEAGWGCQAGQVLSHLAAATSLPMVSRPVRSASVGSLATESTWQEHVEELGALYNRAPGGVVIAPQLFPRPPLNQKERIGGPQVLPCGWSLLSCWDWALCLLLNKAPREGTKP